MSRNGMNKKSAKPNPSAQGVREFKLLCDAISGYERLDREEENKLKESLVKNREERRRKFLMNNRVAEDAMIELKCQFNDEKREKAAPDRIAAFQAAADGIQELIERERNDFRKLSRMNEKDDELAANVTNCRTAIAEGIQRVMVEFELSLDRDFYRDALKELERRSKTLADGSASEIAEIIDETCQDAQEFRQFVAEAKAAFNRYENDRTRLAFSCWRLIPHYVQLRASGYKAIWPDIFQNCILALLEVADRYDPEKGDGLRFCTYADSWVKRAIQLEISKNTCGAVTVGDKVKSEVVRALRELEKELGREPDVEEIMERTRRSRKTVQGVLTALASPVRIDHAQRNDMDDDWEKAGFDIPCQNVDVPDEIVNRRELERTTVEKLEELTERERKIIALHVQENASYADVSKEMNLSPEGARKIAKGAFGKLQTSSLRDYFYN